MTKFLHQQSKNLLSQGKESNNFPQDQENLQDEKNIQSLMKTISSSYTYNRFTLKYNDQSIEQEYQKYAHGEALYFAKIFLIEFLIVQLLVLGFLTYKLVLLKGNDPKYKWEVIVTAVNQIVPTIYYFLMKRFTILSRYFADVCTITTLIGVSEISILANPTNVTSDGYAVMTALLAFLSTVSYSQFSLLISYILANAYIWGRTYKWINDMYRYPKINVYVSMAYILVYYFSRGYHQRERLRFQQSHSQQKLLSLFHNLIRVYHDGILITQQEKIVFSNKQLENIFQIKQDQLNTSNKEIDGIQQDDIESQQVIEDKPSQDLTIIQELKKSKISTSEKYNMFPQHSLILENLNSIWDYVSQSLIRPKSSNNQFVCDGIYFKHEANNDKESIIEEKSQPVEPLSKTLQVFTQVLSIGCQNLTLTTIRDMSQWLELEKEKNLSELKTIAFASAAHEFRNPLNGIVSSLQLIENQMKFSDTQISGLEQPKNYRPDLVSSKRQRQYFHTAQNCSKLMLHLVNDILDFSQMESKSLILNIAETQLKHVIDECASVLVFKAQSKGLDLIIDLTNAEYLEFQTDKNRLVQILVNLISNAIKYTNQGYVKIEAIQKDNQLVLSIIDSGVGIETDKLQQLFTPFTKILNNRDLNKEGVGLGLSISKNLSTALGGNLTAESKIGQGSKFTVTLPILDATYRSNGEQLLATQSDIAVSENFDIEILDSYETQNRQNSFVGIYIKPSILYSSSYRSPNSTNRLDGEDDIESQRSFLINQIQNFEVVENKNCFKQSSNVIASHYTNQINSCQCPDILIVDDDPFNLIALEGLLDQINELKIDKAFNGAEALKMIQENEEKKCQNHHNYKLIFLDKFMPVMDGMDCAQQIRNIEREMNLPHKSLILVTGDENQIKDSVINGKNCEKSLFDEVLLKPLDLNNLQLLLMRFELSII